MKSLIKHLFGLSFMLLLTVPFSAFAEKAIIAHSPDGRLIATGVGNKVLLWYERSDQLIATLEGGEQWITHVQFSPDSQWVSAQFEDQSKKHWNIEEARLPLVLYDQQIKTLYASVKRANALRAYDAVLSKYKYIPEPLVNEIVASEYALYQKQDTIAGYDEFLKKCPNSSQKSQAIASEYALYQQQNTVTGYDEFLKKFPDSSLKEKAIASEYALYQQQNTVKGYDTFLKKFPKATQSQSSVYFALFALHVAPNIEPMYHRFLSQYPKSPQKLRFGVTRSAFQLYLEQDTIADIQSF